MPQAGYTPGSPEYDNWSYGAPPSYFPNPMWGGSSSPAYQTMAPSRDYMARGNQYAGNSAFAAPAGINFGGPLTNFAANMALQGFFGSNMRPMVRPDMADLDYLRSKMRSQLSFDKSPEIFGQDSKYLSMMAPGLAGSNLFRQAFDAINPGGSQKGAFDMIYGRLGTSFGGTVSSQANRSVDALTQMNERFRGRNGLYDYNSSYGLNRMESVDAMDTAMRYGIGGVSASSVKRAVETKKFGDLAQSNNRLFSVAQEVFGKDKGMDELAQLMSQSIDGLQGLDSSKATDLLQKIQATSRAVNISTKAFSEYSSMFNELYKAQGMGGVTAAGHIASSAMTAKNVTELGRKTGDASLSDQSAVMESVGRNRLDLMRSPTMRKAQALASMVANMTDAQAAGIQVKGFGSLGGFMKSGAFQKLLESGDTARLQQFLNAASNSGNPLLGGKAGLDIRARDLSDSDRADAARVADFDRAGDFNGANMRKRFSTNLAGGMDKDLVRAMGGQDGINQALSKFESFKEVSSFASVREKFGKMYGDRMSGADIDRLAQQFSSQMRTQTNNGAALRQYGFASTQDANAAFSGSSYSGKNMDRQSRLQLQKDVSMQAFLKELSGNALKGTGLGDVANETLKLIQDIQGEQVKGADGKTITMEGIKDKDGKIDMSKIGQILKTRGKSLLQVNQMGLLMGAIEGGAAEKASQIGETAYRAALAAGKSKEEAGQARIAAVQRAAQPLAAEMEKFNDPAYAKKMQDQMDKDREIAWTNSRSSSGASPADRVKFDKEFNEEWSKKHGLNITEDTKSSDGSDKFLEPISKIIDILTQLLNAFTSQGKSPNDWLGIVQRESAKAPTAQ